MKWGGPEEVAGHQTSSHLILREPLTGDGIWKIDSNRSRVRAVTLLKGTSQILPLLVAKPILGDRQEELLQDLNSDMIPVDQSTIAYARPLWHCRSAERVEGSKDRAA